MSGESAAAFFAARGIKLNTFYNWLAKEQQTSPPAFQEVRMPAPLPGREVRVCLPDRVEVCMPPMIALIMASRSAFRF